MSSGVQKIWTCACCGKEFEGLPSLAFDVPVQWDKLSRLEKWRSRKDSDFCEVTHNSGETDRFIRCVLPIPVPDINEEFTFGVWISVSETSWRNYRSGYETGEYPTERCFGYLMHEIPGYPSSTLLHCDVVFQPNNQRPRVELHETDHPLFAAQNDDVSKVQIDEWVSLGHRRQVQ